jgi:hypothetical protein
VSPSPTLSRRVSLAHRRRCRFHAGSLSSSLTQGQVSRWVRSRSFTAAAGTGVTPGFTHLSLRRVVQAHRRSHRCHPLSYAHCRRHWRHSLRSFTTARPAPDHRCHAGSRSLTVAATGFKLGLFRSSSLAPESQSRSLTDAVLSVSHKVTVSRAHCHRHQCHAGSAGPVSLIDRGRRHWCHAGLHSFIISPGRAGSSPLALSRSLSPATVFARSLPPAPLSWSDTVSQNPAAKVSLVHRRRPPPVPMS